MGDTLGSRRRVVWMLVSCLAFTPLHSVLAQERKQHRVLVLHPSAPGAAGGVASDVAYQRVLGEALRSRLDFHSEFIDLARFGGAEFRSSLRDFLRLKYARLPPDVVIASNEASRWLLDEPGADLFPGVPVVYVDRGPPARRRPGTTGVSAPLDLAATLDLALALQPETETVLVVSGVSEFDRIYDTAARKQLQRFAGRVSIRYLAGLTLSEIVQAAAHPPPHSIIYFLTVGEDGTGAKFRPTDALDRVAAAANAPIYCWSGVAMGHGIVGGRLYMNEIVAERVSAVALRILQGENVDGIPAAAIDPLVTQLDWRQLQRWHIGSARIPPAAAILFRDPSLWDRYRAYIVSALALVVFQSALIGGLLVQRARRRRVEAALRENQAIIQASNKQISDLFGQLITAQETERSRLARDLHDDVSQRIAGLSIMISGLKARLVGDTRGSGLMHALSSMQQNTIDLAEQIRQVSHDLHPNVLQHAGLVAALSGFCAQFEKMHAVSIAFTAGADIGSLDADSSLCLYRIAQESLRNVAKHSDAHHVAVALIRTADGIQLSIADDGKGFDLAGTRARAGGLGLVSIDERVRLLRGHVQIETQPRGGTRVVVRIPVTVPGAHQPVRFDAGELSV